MFNVAFSKHLRDNNIKHYESGFKPQTVSLDKLRRGAFSPTVYRNPSEEELTEVYKVAAHKKELTPEEEATYIKSRMYYHRNGYRAYKFVVGLLDSGYVDIDGVTPDTVGVTPTIDNVAKAMTDKGLYNIVFQSASAKPGKLRLLYKRDFMLYLPGTYNVTTQEWALIPSHDPKTILTTAPEGHSIHSLLSKDIKLTKLIQNILYQETMYISSILASANINTSGIDASACAAHMHSAHTTLPNKKYLDVLYSDGETL